MNENDYHLKTLYAISKSIFDRILVVDCEETIQMERVISRDRLANEAVVAIMKAQASREDRLAIADDIIINNGPTSQLNDQVQSLHETYQDLYQEWHGIALDPKGIHGSIDFKVNNTSFSINVIPNENFSSPASKTLEELLVYHLP